MTLCFLWSWTVGSPIGTDKTKQANKQTKKPSSHSSSKKKKKPTNFIAVVLNLRNGKIQTFTEHYIRTGWKKRTEIQIYSEKWMAWLNIFALLSLPQLLLVNWKVFLDKLQFHDGWNKVKWIPSVSATTDTSTNHLCPAAQACHRDLDLTRAYKHPEAKSLSKYSHDSLENWS